MDIENGPKSSVVFVDISDAYIPGNDITCTFSVSTVSPLSIAEGCWIGLFRVGWEEIDESVSRVCVSKAFKLDNGEVKTSPPLTEGTKAQVTFSASAIPSTNDGEYFQFCFITGDGSILGASGPFLICASKVTNELESLYSTGSSSAGSVAKKTETDELEWCPWLDISEEADDGLLVHSKTTLLEKSLAKVVGENGGLRESLEEKNAIIEKLQSEVQDVQAKVAAQAAFIADCRKQQENSLIWIEELQEKLGGCEEEKKSLEEKIKQLNGVVANLEEQKSDLRKDMDLLSKDLQLARGKELQKVCQGYENRLAESVKAISDLECAYRESKEFIAEMKIIHKEELNKMSKSFDDALNQLNIQCLNVENMESQKHELCLKLDKMTHSFAEERRDLYDQIEHLEGKIKTSVTRESSELNQLRRDLQSSEALFTESEANAKQLKLLLSNKCDELAKVKESLYSSHHRQNGDLLECQMELRHVISELEAARGENSVLKEKCNGHNGARHALQVAYKHTQKQLSALKEDHEALSQKYQSLSHESKSNDKPETVKELKDRVEDLKLRLCIGANAYREKVLQCKMLLKELKKYTDRSDLLPADLTKEPESTLGSSVLEPKQPTNESVLSELKTIIARLRKEADMKDEAIKELHIKLQTSEDTFKVSLQGMTAELVSLKKDLRDRESKVLSLQSRKTDPSVQSVLKSPDIETADSERKGSSTAVSTNPPEISPSQLAHPRSQCNYVKRIYYPPAYSPIYDSNPVGGAQSQRGVVSRDVPLARGVVSPDGDTSPSKQQTSADISSERLRTPTGNEGQRVVKATECCPVCDMVFPLGTSEVTATNHVNLHFEGASNA